MKDDDVYAVTLFGLIAQHAGFDLANKICDSLELHLRRNYMGKPWHMGAILHDGGKFRFVTIKQRRDS
jgi:hypothetical protein